MFSESIPVNLIRQWKYCPRIVYYREVLHLSAVYPPWVRQGEQFHEEETRLWLRRKLSRFGVQTGKVVFSFSMKSSRHLLHGEADMLIETEEEVIPVEFKLSGSMKRRGGLLQLVAYGLLAAETIGKKSSYGFLAIGKNEIKKIVFDEKFYSELFRAINGIRKLFVDPVKPDSSATMLQCTNCEYLNFCADRT